VHAKSPRACEIGGALTEHLCGSSCSFSFFAGSEEGSGRALLEGVRPVPAAVALEVGRFLQGSEGVMSPYLRSPRKLGALASMCLPSPRRGCDGSCEVIFDCPTQCLRAGRPERRAVGRETTES
jgi:hypothetical protein